MFVFASGYTCTSWLIEFILALGNPADMEKISPLLVRKSLGNTGEILGEIIGKMRQNWAENPGGVFLPFPARFPVRTDVQIRQK
jgi:hypothetical protein